MQWLIEILKKKKEWRSLDIKNKGKNNKQESALFNKREHFSVEYTAP